MKSTTNMSNPEHRTLNAILADQSPEQLQAIGQALAAAAAESQALLSEVMATSHPGGETAGNTSVQHSRHLRESRTVAGE